MEQLRGTGKPFWANAKIRYCTSDLKRGPIDKFYRDYHGVIISAEDIRAQESSARAHRPLMKFA
jgi:3'-phosphoadenosine 5'-phosphosulfate sulfotransferase (PAPS reductase)/FAD synthetase